jgi:hypothetical protein
MYAIRKCVRISFREIHRPRIREEGTPAVMAAVLPAPVTMLSLNGICVTEVNQVARSPTEYIPGAFRPVHPDAALGSGPVGGTHGASSGGRGRDVRRDQVQWVVRMVLLLASGRYVRPPTRLVTKSAWMITGLLDRTCRRRDWLTPVARCPNLVWNDRIYTKRSGDSMPMSNLRRPTGQVG